MAGPNPADTMAGLTFLGFAPMEFAARLIYLRKQKGLTQQALADAVGVHRSQIRRYEAGETYPSLDALKMLSIALGVSADALLFDADERAPGDDFRLQLDVISHLDADEQRIIREVLDGMLLKYQARRWSAPPPPAKRPGRAPVKHPIRRS
jgi:transcriptional regulator with XRE-family HTH domain